MLRNTTNSLENPFKITIFIFTVFILLLEKNIIKGDFKINV